MKKSCVQSFSKNILVAKSEVMRRVSSQTEGPMRVGRLNTLIIVWHAVAVIFANSPVIGGGASCFPPSVLEATVSQISTHMPWMGIGLKRRL